MPNVTELLGGTWANERSTANETIDKRFRRPRHDHQRRGAMSASKRRTVRRRKQRRDDGKGLRRMIAGRRVRVPHGAGDREGDQRFPRIEDLWRDNEAFCQRIRREVEWTDIGRSTIIATLTTRPSRTRLRCRSVGLGPILKPISLCRSRPTNRTPCRSGPGRC